MNKYTMWRARWVAGLTLLCVVALIPGTAEGQLYASEPDGSNNLLTLDLGSGAATVVGTFAGAEGPISAIEWSPDGNTLYASTDADASTLHTISAFTGAIQTSVTLGILGELSGLDFDNTGTLFGSFIPVPTVIDPPPSFLVTVDPLTGAITILGEIGPMTIVGIAFDSSFQTLYAIDSGTEEGDPDTEPFMPPVLYRIDRFTGQIISDETTTMPALASSLEFDSLGRLLTTGIDDRLYSLNVITGAATLVGTMFSSTGMVSGLSTRCGGTLAVSPLIRNVSRFSGTTNFNVRNVGICPMTWTAQVTSPTPWLTIISGLSGVNNGTIEVAFSENSDRVSRFGTIVVTAENAAGGSVILTVAQEAAIPILDVTPADQTVGLSMGTTGYKVSNVDSGRMQWTARVVTNSPWMNIISGFSGINGGAVQVAFSENPGPDSRVAVLEVSAPSALQSPARLTLTQRPSVLIDLTMSLYGKPKDPAYPRGDDDGNTQDGNFPSEQDNYELLLNHFSDAVYEATDRRHKINRITIFERGGRPQDTDITWREAGHPNTRVVAGAGLRGAPLNMYDVFTGGTGSADLPFLQSAEGLQIGGYVLAQRWMHYLLGIEHEFAETPGDVPVFGTLMADPYEAAASNDPAFLNLSAAPNRPGPFSGGLRVFDTSRANAQLRLYRLSAWETLAQLNGDPRMANELAVAARIYQPELGAVAPIGLAFPNPDDLLQFPGDSRADLDIVWDSGQQASVIVLDNSGSMAGLLLENAKQAAKLVVDKAIEGRSSIGMVTFTDQARTIFPVSAVTSDAVRTAMKNSIDAISTIFFSYGTNIQAGAIKGLELLLDTPTTTPKVVHLLTDGFSFVDTQSVIAQYNALDVPMFTFAFGAGADTVLLGALAEGTGGLAFQTSTSLSDIALAFDEANARFLGAVTVDQVTAALGSVVQHFNFPIDVSVGRLDVTAVFDSLPAGATVLLVDPEGNVIFPVSSNTNSAANTLQVFVVDDPSAGLWSIVAHSRLEDIGFEFSVTALLENSPITFSVNSIHGESLQYPTPLVLQANLGLGLGIRNAEVTATIRTPSGEVKPLEFRDDGVPPDAISGDGSYAATTNYFLDGEHVIAVMAVNTNQRARLTYNGTRRSPADGGVAGPQALTQLPDAPLREPFVRETTITVDVSGVVADNHGDFFQEATVVTTDNVSTFGRFERSRDLDFFKFTIPAGLTSVSARVTDIGGKSNARLTILGIDGFTVLAQGRKSKAGYLVAVANVIPGLTYFALVEETSTNLAGGRYAFSVGPEIASDNALPRFAIGGGGGGGGCLIATAAYGTPLAEEIEVLRALRDTRLLRGAFGTAFVDTYYRLSPPIADAVASNEVLRAGVRLVLVPVLVAGKITLAIPTWVVMVLVLSAFAAWPLRRRAVTRRS